MSKLDKFIADEKLDDFVSDMNPAQTYLDGLAPSGRQSQDHALRVIAALLGFEHWHDVPWGDLTYRHTRKIQNELIHSKYAVRTVKRMIAALRGVLKEAWRLEIMSASDYQRAIDLPKIRGGDDQLAGRMLSPHEIRLFYESCLDGSHRGYRDAAIFAALRLGLRLKEVASLKISDIIKECESLAIRVTGKGAKTRIVPLDGQVCQALEEWLRVRGYENGYLFRPIKKNDIIIPRGLGKMSIYQMLLARQRRLGMQRWTPHDMRRTMISELLESSDISVAQGLAGHKNASQTAKYDRRPSDARREAVKKLKLY